MFETAKTQRTILLVVIVMNNEYKPVYDELELTIVKPLMDIWEITFDGNLIIFTIE